MDCQSFFEAVETTLGDRCERPSRTTSGTQCVYEFFHPRVAEVLGTRGLATRFNRSGIVWAPPEDRLGVTVRVPATCEDGVTDALAAAPFAFEQTDHRGVAAPDGEMVTILHYSLRTAGVTPGTLEATLSAVGTALEV